MRLQGKVAIVTGAASGFGTGIAQVYIENGAKVAVVDRDGEGAARIAGELGANAIAITCDVTQAADVEAAVEATIKAFGPPGIVVNNAGTSHKNQPLLDTTEAEFDRVFAVNVKSIYHMAQAVIPVMRAQGHGVVINIGSTAGLRPRPGLSWYNATKGAVNTLSKSMAVELAPENIRVCAIAPVIGATALLETFMGQPDTPELRAKFIQTIPMGRMSTPKDIANAALFLASDDAEFLTGVVLEVDGGRCI